MSSLRLALKQSLAETGHLAIQDKSKRKHNHASSRHPNRKRKTSKEKQSSSKNLSRKKTYLMSDPTERGIEKDSVGQFPLEGIGRSMSSVSASSRNPNAVDTDGGANLPSASGNARSFSSDDDSSFSDSDTVTNSSSCSSHHRHHHRMQSSDDESSSQSQNDEDEVQEDMEGVFDVEGTSADESYAPNQPNRQRVNSAVQTNHRELQQDQIIQPQEDETNQQQEPTRKKKKKKKDKARRKKDRQKQIVASSSNSIQGEEHESNEHVIDYKRSSDQSDGGENMKSRVAMIQASTSQQNIEDEQPSYISRHPIKKQASDFKMTVKAPNSNVLDWVAGMSKGKQRRKILVGMRVKVCFEFKSGKRGSDGKNVRYFRWCGGGVTYVGVEGKEIRILYDDGTLEKTTFPDREIVVDDDENGKHQVPADAFLPKQPARLMSINDSNQNVDSGHEILKGMHHNQSVVDERLENSISDMGHRLSLSDEYPPQSVENISKQNISKAVKVERFEEINVGKPQQANIYTRVNNCAAKILHGNNSPKSMATKGGIVEAKANDLLSRPSFESNNSGRAYHQASSGSSHGDSNCGQGSQVNQVKGEGNQGQGSNSNDDGCQGDGGKGGCVGQGVEGEGCQNEGDDNDDGDGDGHQGNGDDKYADAEEVETDEDGEGRKINAVEGKSNKALGEGEGQVFGQTESLVQVATQSGAKFQDASSVRVSSKKLTLKCRKSPSVKNSNNTSKNSGIDSISENKSSNYASENITRQENSTPVLKLRLKTKSKNKIRADKAGNTHNLQGEYGISKIKIKSDPDDVSARESWSSFTGAKNSNDEDVQTHGKSSAYTHGDSAWLGDDEGQGLRRSQSELEEASESENDTSKLNTDGQSSRPGYQVHPNGAGNASHAPSGTQTSNMTAINFLLKGRRHSMEEKGNRGDTLKNNAQLPAFMTPASESSPDGMPKKKRPRSLNSGVNSQRSSSPRSPKSVKGGTMGQVGAGSTSTLAHENQFTLVKKRKKDKQIPVEQIVTHDHNDAKLDNSKELSKHTRPDSEDLTLQLRSRSANEDGNFKHSQVRSARKVQKTAKQKIMGKDDSTIQYASNKGKRKSKSGKSGSSKEVKEDNNGGENWVQCDKCKKWRCIPSYIDVKDLPEHWYCKDNPDKSRNTCEAAEQTQEEVTKFNLDKSRSQNHDTLTNKITDKATCKPAPVRNGVIVDDTVSDIGVNGTLQYDSAVTNKSTSSDLFDGHTSEVQLTPNQLSGCEIDGTGSDGTTASTLPTNKHMKGSSSKKSRKSKGEEREKKGSKGKKQKDPINQEWVQCEKCEKWRRLPPRIKAKDLPDVWTCDMNDWDPRSASCAVAEDHKVDKTINPDKDIIGKDGLSSGVQKNKLSYKNLIRLPNRTISERTRATDSLFSSCATDPDKPPTVLYANSSAFQHRGGIYRPSEEEKPEITLFSYMNKSELWKDLYHYASQSTLSGSDVKYDVNVGKTKTRAGNDHIPSMKAMVYYALGAQTLHLHDVLLECQCREWEDLQWADLRASCTIESVQLALNGLVKDGSVEASPTRFDYNEVKSDIISYRKKQTTPQNGGPIKKRSRCMKISKPWKLQRSSLGV